LSGGAPHFSRRHKLAEREDVSRRTEQEGPCSSGGIQSGFRSGGASGHRDLFSLSGQPFARQGHPGFRPPEGVWLHSAKCTVSTGSNYHHLWGSSRFFTSCRDLAGWIQSNYQSTGFWVFFEGGKEQDGRPPGALQITGQPVTGRRPWIGQTG